MEAILIMKRLFWGLIIFSFIYLGLYLAIYHYGKVFEENAEEMSGYINKTDSHWNTESQSVNRSVFSGIIQRSRQARITNYCTHKGYYVGNSTQRIPKKTLQMIHRNLWFDDVHKVIYCKIPKSGSSSTMGILANSSPKFKGPLSDLADIAQTPTKLSKLGLVRGNFIDYEVILHKLNTYYKFMMVRHPLERLVSVYHDKMEYQPEFKPWYRPYIIDHFRLNKTTHGLKSYMKNYPKWLIHELQYNTLNRSNISDEIQEHLKYVPPFKENSPYLPTFEEFLRYIIHSGFSDEHWDGYNHRCAPCQIKYDFIGKLETSDMDYESIIEQMNKTFPIKEILSKHLRHLRNNTGTSTNCIITKINITENAQISIPDVACVTKTKLHKYQNVRPNIMESIMRIYKSDMDMFGYDWQPHRNYTALSYT